MAVLEQLGKTSDERFLSIYESLTERGFGPLDGEVAKVLKFRPQAIKKLPLEKRARSARKIIESRSNAELAYELFGTYLVKTRKDLVTGFLDATGVEHEDGMIQDLDGTPPDPARIPEAIAKLDGAHAPEDVTLYLALCVEMWPRSEELQQAWEAR
jgi:uncharacterized protein (UPF0297 family)